MVRMVSRKVQRREYSSSAVMMKHGVCGYATDPSGSASTVTGK